MSWPGYLYSWLGVHRSYHCVVLHVTSAPLGEVLVGCIQVSAILRFTTWDIIILNTQPTEKFVVFHEGLLLSLPLLSSANLTVESTLELGKEETHSEANRSCSDTWLKQRMKHVQWLISLRSISVWIVILFPLQFFNPNQSSKRRAQESSFKKGETFKNRHFSGKGCNIKGDLPLAFPPVASYSLMLYLKDPFFTLWFSVCAGAEAQWPGKAATIGFLLASHSAVALGVLDLFQAHVLLSMWLIACSDGCQDIWIS